MQSAIIESLMDSLKMLPFLFAVYAIIELLEYRFGDSIRVHIVRASRVGPLLGALFGCIPQCGFSVMGAALYGRGLITTGTLVAIFLSTSDEAVPIILTQPDHAALVLPLLGTKILVAIAGGFAVDFLFSRNWKPREAALPEPVWPPEAEGCRGHHVSEGKRKIELLLHPLRHTLTVFVFLFATTLALNAAMAYFGAEKLGTFLLRGSVLQPAVAALVGLIPNCAASVAITQVYLAGGLTFGSLIAGLSASSGAGLLVLFREAARKRDIAWVIVLLLAISILAGVVIQFLTHP